MLRSTSNSTKYEYRRVGDEKWEASTTRSLRSRCGLAEYLALAEGKVQEVTSKDGQLVFRKAPS